MPEVLRLDSSNQKLHAEGFFDSILCDPPYGKCREKSIGDINKVHQVGEQQ